MTSLTLSSLQDEEVVRIRVTTFAGDTSEHVSVGGVLNKGVATPFQEMLAEAQIAWSDVQAFSVETFEGKGAAYGRISPDVSHFKPVDWV